MRVFRMGFFVLGIYNLANYFALWCAEEAKRYFKKAWPIMAFGNIGIILMIAFLY